MPKPKIFKVAKCDLERTACIQEQILIVRQQRVLMDADLAKLYGVTTKRLNQQFRRNRHRFPEDFAFQLTLTEAKETPALRLQNATLKRGQHIKYAPHVFTEHGTIMLASVLNSPVAVQASIYVVRAFVQMRAAVQEYAELSRRIDELAANCDDQFQEIFDAIRQLMGMPATPARPTGFIPTGRKRLKEKK
jgi:hypothetical protein